MAVPNVQSGPGMADHQTFDPQVATSLNQDSEWEVYREVAMRVFDVRSVVGIHENARDAIRHSQFTIVSIFAAVCRACWYLA